jgi:gliding motility-associated-like protein
MRKIILSAAFFSLSTLLLSQSKAPVDSLAGFDYVGSMHHASHAKTDQQKHEMLQRAKRTYIDGKYNLYNQNQITNPNGERSSAEYYANVKNGNANRGSGNTTLSQGNQPVGCTNIDFEQNSTATWSVTGDFQVMNGGVDPFGGFPCVYPGGGNYSLRLNDNNTSCSGPNRKVNFHALASRTVAVTPLNNQFQLHFAAVILNFPHPANAAANFQINFYDQAGNKLACPTYSCYYASPPNAFIGLPPGIAQTAPMQGAQICSTVGSYPVTYVPWQTVAVDLSPYNLQNIVIKISCDWCLYNYDWAYCYVDADCGPPAPTTPVTSCTGLLNGPPGMVSYTWTPPVGPTVVSPTIMATTPGTYVCSTTGFITCQPGSTYTYIVKPAPIAAFTNNTSCLTSPSSFTSTSTLNGGSGITNYNWTWGDMTANTIGMGFNQPNHTYGTAGTFSVQLLVTNADGCKDSITQNVKVNGLPVVDFTFNNICEGAPTVFNNTTNANGNTMTNWYWDFTSDGSIDNTTISPTLTYSTSGTHNVTLIGVTSVGCSDTIVKAVNVFSNPVSHFGFTRTCLGDYTNFWDNSYVVGSNGVINSWGWDLDGNTTIDATGQNAMALYNTYGNHVVGLTVTTSFGCKNTSTLNVFVNPIPVVDFAADQTHGCEKLPVIFTNNSYIPVGTIATYSWSVGDNASTINFATTHTYPAGTYTVSLTAISDSGCVAIKTKNDYIVSYPRPVADYFANPQTADVLEPIVNFVNTSGGAYNQFWWFYGDGSPTDSTTHHPSHTYSDEFATSYMTTLIVKNSYGCSDTTQRLVVIDPSYVIYVPNAFTPNGDGLNDVFQAKGYYILKFDMQVFDRWGEQVFSTNDIYKGWDGTIKGKIIENSVYVWKVTVIDIQKKRHDLTGHVTLMK